MATHAGKLRRWTTALNVELLLPPRQSRGASFVRLVLSTTFSCYVLLNDNDEARLHDHFENHVFAGSFATTPILAFGFITDRLVLPTPRAVERDKPLEFYERFIPTDEIVLGVY